MKDMKTLGATGKHSAAGMENGDRSRRLRLSALPAGFLPGGFILRGGFSGSFSLHRFLHRGFRHFRRRGLFGIILQFLLLVLIVRDLNGSVMQQHVIKRILPDTVRRVDQTQTIRRTDGKKNRAVVIMKLSADTRNQSEQKWTPFKVIWAGLNPVHITYSRRAKN